MHTFTSVEAWCPWMSQVEGWGEYQCAAVYYHFCSIVQSPGFIISICGPQVLIHQRYLWSSSICDPWHSIGICDPCPAVGSQIPMMNPIIGICDQCPAVGSQILMMGFIIGICDPWHCWTWITNIDGMPMMNIISTCTIEQK